MATAPAHEASVDFFDHNSIEYSYKRHDWYKAIRDTVGPVFWSPHYGGFWVAIGWEEVAGAAKDWETFSSRGFAYGKDADRPVEPGDDLNYNGLFVPPRQRAARLLEDDPPVWRQYRQLMQPLFTPGAVSRWRDRLERLVDACIDRCIETGKIDFALDLSDIIPAIFSLELVGLPNKFFQEASENHHFTAHLRADDPRWEEAMAWINEEVRLTNEMIRDYTAMPRSDRPTNNVVGHLVNAREDGAQITDEDIASMAALTIGGGIDTTAAMLGTTFTILSENPALKQQLIDHPEIIEDSFNEFMRIAAPTQGLCRTVTKDTELGGQKLKRGDRIMLCWAAANRDPREFERPEDVVLDRKPNRHVGFGYGNHRCIGTYFAKLEYELIMAAVLKRLPDFKVDMDKAAPYDNVGIVAGWTTIPATFTPGPRVDADPGIEGWDYRK